MTHIIFDNKRINLSEGQTVLSALLERNYNIPNSCQAGVCQSCLMQLNNGKVPAAAQNGLKNTLKAQGYFLSCSCIPNTPLEISMANDANQRCTATVSEHRLLSSDILCLRLTIQNNFEYRAGQFINLWKDKTLGRSYSLASVSTLDDDIELHIRRIKNGEMSNWLHDNVRPGDKLDIQTATGNCFYIADKPEQKIILAGTGTGLAPLIGIARDALQQQHQGEIHLLHGAIKTDGLYQHQKLLRMAEQYEKFYYHANVLQRDDKEIADNVIHYEHPLEQHITEIMQQSKDYKAYLCGDADTVNKLKKTLFISGISMNNIYSDPFIMLNKS